MDRISFITHDGREILLLDFSRLKAQEAIALIEPAKAVISSKPVIHNKPYVRAAAVVGITGLKRVIFNAVIAFSRRKLVTFDDRETAKKWLKEQ
jgi:hypothetical protein